MAQSSYNAIGILILKFRDILEYLFEPKEKTNLEKLHELNNTLVKEFNLSLIEISGSNFEELKPKLEKLTIIFLDDLILSIYQNTLDQSSDKLIISLKSNQNLYSRLLELIHFTESKTNKLSLVRNNIKNSLEHKST